MTTMRIASLTLVFLVQMLSCSALDDSSFQLINKATGLCLVRKGFLCSDIRWTTAGRLLVEKEHKCLGVQGKSVGSEVSLYDCDETSDLQKWECTNETVLALQGQELYIELRADSTAVLSKTTGTNSHLTISGTSSGACTRTYRELYTIRGNAAGRLCMFPFYYKNQWYSSCTVTDSENNLNPWCAVETKYEHETWGYCPTNNKYLWIKHPISGAAYQLNTDSALTWAQAETSCKQQSSSLLSITDPHEQAYITTLLEATYGYHGYKLWTGLTLNSEHGWKWSNGDPFRYIKWDSGYPISDPGHSCGIIDGAVRFSWQSLKCDKKLGYICYSKGALATPTEGLEMGFCSAPWTPFNGHCYHLQRTEKTWSDAQLACNKEGGDLVSIRNVEDQSFVISQLGHASTDELWIGLNDRKTEGLFDWSDHSTVRFTSWEFGRPTFTPGQEDCVLIRGEIGNWADRSCTEKHGFICMKRSASEPSGDEVEQNPGCKTGWKRHGSYCYFIGTQTKTFDEAKVDCRSSDSYLADVSTRVDNAFLVSLVGLRSEKHFWLGLSNQVDKDVFKWTNTDSVRFTHWNAEMPGIHQGCVAMATGSFAGLWNVLPCTNSEKYICKHLAEGEVVTPATPTVPSITCADGWNKVESRNFCYKVFSETLKPKTWYEARDYCKALGGDLLSIHGAAELKLRNLWPMRFRTLWIGLSAPDPGAGYVWSDGSPVNFQQWHDGEPNNKNNVESCAEVSVYPWKRVSFWYDTQCEKLNGWICQIRTGVTPKLPPPPATPDYNITSDGWFEWKENQYFINNQVMAMEEARHFCKQRHGDLVTISSEAENQFLWKQISYNFQSCWIGLTVDFDKTMQWMDKSPMLFQRWDEGQPNFSNFDENCVIMLTNNGFWHDYNCGYEYRSICKRSSSAPANTTVAPTVAPKGGCKDTWKKINSKCYKIINNQNATWFEARQQCMDMGGNLASISSRFAQVFLMLQMTDAPTTDLWIGFHSLYGGGFYWTDGRPKTYYNLAFSLPQKNCVLINTNPLLGVGKWLPKSCNDTNGFICLKDLDPSLPDSPKPTSSSNYIKILNDSIKLVPQQMSWDAAKKHCEADGASLASLRTEWTQAYLELLALILNRPVWIGLNSELTKGYYRYVDGWSIDFTHWGINEPSGNRSCVYVDVDGKWKSSDCDQSISSVCMKSTDVPPKEEQIAFPGVCPEDPDEIHPGRRNSWKPFRGFCYKFFAKKQQWGDSASSCVEHGGMLVSIENPFEKQFIEDSIRTFHDSHTSYWTGLFRSDKGAWKWLDRTVMDYTNWGADRHSYGKYGLINTADGKWRTDIQWNHQPYICKTAKVMLPKPSPSPLSPDVGLIPPGRGRIILVAVIVIAGLAVGIVIVLLVFKNSGRHLPITNLPNFDNPLFFSNNRSRSDLVDSKISDRQLEGT